MPATHRENVEVSAGICEVRNMHRNGYNNIERKYEHATEAFEPGRSKGGGINLGGSDSKSNILGHLAHRLAHSEVCKYIFCAAEYAIELVRTLEALCGSRKVSITSKHKLLRYAPICEDRQH